MHAKTYILGVCKLSRRSGGRRTQGGVSVWGADQEGVSMGGAEVATFKDELEICDPIPVHTVHYFFNIMSKNLPVCLRDKHHMCSL